MVNGRQSFSPIFRDVTELTASHSLSEKIRQALQDSSFLIVLCSPAAKDSHWVNEEIRLFRSLHGDRAILSAIVEGTPSSSFPPALLENGHEPLAANLKQGRDSFRFGVHQLAASILGVGLDTLVRRGERKRRLRTQLFMGATTAIAIAMGGLWFNAQNAQKAAEKSRDDAERLVEYMVSDLKSELYGLQRLDILDGLGEEIVEYYEGIDPERLPNERLVKQITALQTLAEVSSLERNFDNFDRYIADASRLIKVLENRDPNGEDSLFYRAQNEYWIGASLFARQRYQEVLEHWTNYKNMGLKGFKRNPDSLKWQMEAGWGYNNVALLNRRVRNYETALDSIIKAREVFSLAYANNKTDTHIAYEYANILIGVATVYERLDEFEKAIEIRLEASEVFRIINTKSGSNYKAKHYDNQNKHRLLQSQGHSPCLSEKFTPVTAEAYDLLLYEPDNTNWREEYLLHFLIQLEDCVTNHSETNVTKRHSDFLSMLQKPENEFFARKFAIRINKLQVK